MLGLLFVQFLLQIIFGLPSAVEALADVPPYVFIELAFGVTILCFLLFIGLTLLVALFGPGDMGVNAREVLRLLLNFLQSLLREIRKLFGSSA